jgi:hypothetical protein
MSIRKMDPGVIPVGLNHIFAICPDLDRFWCFQWTALGRKDAPVLFGSVHHDGIFDIDGTNRAFFEETKLGHASGSLVRYILNLRELWADEAWFTVEACGHEDASGSNVEWYNLKLLAVRARTRSVVAISDRSRAEL